MGLGFDDGRVFGIDGGNATVALQHALVGGHLGAVVVGAVALANFTFAALAVVGVGGEPLTEFGGLVPVAGEALGVLVGQVGFDREGVVGAVAFEHLLGGLFELGGVLLEVGAGTAPGLAGVAGEFDAVDGKHLAADEALPVTEPEDLAEDVGDGLVAAGDEGGEGCEVGCGVAREGDEGDVFPAGTLDRPGTDEAAAVGEQDDLEQRAGG